MSPISIPLDTLGHKYQPNGRSHMETGVLKSIPFVDSVERRRVRESEGGKSLILMETGW